MVPRVLRFNPQTCARKAWFSKRTAARRSFCALGNVSISLFYFSKNAESQVRSIPSAVKQALDQMNQAVLPTVMLHLFIISKNFKHVDHIEVAAGRLSLRHSRKKVSMALRLGSRPIVVLFFDVVAMSHQADLSLFLTWKVSMSL